MAGDAGSEPQEKRRYERLNRSYKVCYRYLVDLAAPSAAREGLVLDIGGGGLRFLSTEPVDESSQLAMVVEFAGWLTEGGEEWVATRDHGDVARLEVIAVVTHQQMSQSVPGRYEIGVRFCGRIR
ncbi:MAG: hypothetical protein OEV91_01230 [Desulfobulbaceae bacterium]|nr:hypothetical protein [Desulfobulbaceae bacterium]